MSDVQPTDLSALTPDDADALPGLVAAVLAGDPPRGRLEQELTFLEQAQKVALAAALYESVQYRIDAHDYWLYFRMWRIYEQLGTTRQDAAYFAASLAVQLHPDWSGSRAAFTDLFRILRRRGQDREAVALFRHQMDFCPEFPAAEPSEILPLLRRWEAPAALAPAAAAARGDRRDHPVFAAETRPPWFCPAFGAMPDCLRLLGKPMQRSAISVAELADAEVLIYRDAVLVIDNAGVLHDDLSVAQFPAEVRRRLEREDQAVERHEADVAVVISDRFPPPNLCHTLFDQISRLALYQHVGVDTAQALVVGPEQRTAYQEQILRRAGVARSLGTDRLARLRVRRLFVSSNCRDLWHAGHLGAAWAVDYVRQILGGRGTRGWRRLYLSRADAQVRQVVNEADIVRQLEQQGFEMIVPGRLPYEAQLSAFRQASHVVTAHGAALAHLVLCPPEAQVLEIFHPLAGTSAYAMQAAAGGINYAAMVARDGQSDAPEWNDPDSPNLRPRGYGNRHVHVDPDTLARYLATVL